MVSSQLSDFLSAGRSMLFELVQQFCHTACIMFLCEILGRIAVTWLPANGDLNKQPQSVLVGEKFHGILGSAHSSSSCHILVVTRKSPLIKNICLLLLGFFFFFFSGKYLFCCSLAIQPVTFCFEGQELSIKTLIS